MSTASQGVNVRRYRIVRNVVLVALTLVLLGGFLLRIPKIAILEHTARNLYFHVPMWFTMMAAGGVSAWHALRFLGGGGHVRDIRSEEAARLAMGFGLLGLATGIVWARFTWYQGTDVWWNFDPKQSLAAVQVLIYGGYFVLRSTVEDEERRARLAAAFNLFAFVTLPFLLYVLPRQMESLHPGAEGNPAFSDITHPVMRVVFYPACLAFIGLFWVLYTQRVRLRLLHRRLAPAPAL